LEFTEFILQSDNLETLATHLASVNRAFTAHVEHFFMGVGIIFNTRSHTDNDSPGRVGSENEDGVIDSSELRVDSRLHLVPLIQLNGILGDGSTVGRGRVTMESVTLGHLRLVVLTIRLHERPNVLHGGAKSISDLLKG
jgi:hypothetical protein